MAAAEAGALIVIHSLRSGDARVEQRFMERSRILEQIRSSIYLSGTVARDSLLAPVGSASSQLVELNNLQKQTDLALQTYEKSLEPEEATPFASLRSEIGAYWKVLNRTFAWTNEEREKYRYQFFYSELIPRRTAMLQITDRVGQLNERGLQHGEQQLTGLFERLRLGLMGMIAVTLMGGSALAAYTGRMVLREVRSRLEENIETKISLRELSAKLVRVQEEERRALARELHDEAGQSFSAILLDTENLLDVEYGTETRSHLESARDLAQRGLAGGRNMAHDVAALHAGRFRTGAGVKLASQGNDQENGLASSGLSG